MMQHPEVLGLGHQTSVDAYAAQHVGPQMRPMTVCFALNGLYLVLDAAGRASLPAPRTGTSPAPWPGRSGRRSNRQLRAGR